MRRATMKEALMVFLLVTTSNAQLSNIPTKLMRARVGAAGRSDVGNRKLKDRGHPQLTSSTRRRQLKRDDDGGGLRQFMSMDTSTATATTKPSTTTSTSATTTSSTVSKDTDRQVDDGVLLSDVSTLTVSPSPSDASSSGSTTAASTTTSQFMPSSSPIQSVSTTSTTSATSTTTGTATTPGPTSITSSTSNDVSTLSSNSPSATDGGHSFNTITTTTSPTQASSTTTATRHRHGPEQTTGLTISLVGMTSIPNRSQWESTTSSYYMSVYNNKNNNKYSGDGGDENGGEPNSGITNVKVQISITNVAIVPISSGGGSRSSTSNATRKRRRKLYTKTGYIGDDPTTTFERKLQPDMSVQVTYTQTMWYTTTTTMATEDSFNVTTNDVVNTHTALVQYPLSTDAYRDEYVGQLKHALDGYEDLTAVSAISTRQETVNYAESGGDGVLGGGNLSLGAVVAMAAGGAALLTILGIMIYFHCKECRSKEVMECDDDDEEEYESSTNHRQWRNSTTTGGQTLDGGCSTVDYDYQRPGHYSAGAIGHGGGVSGLSYISDAMGTLGSRSSRRTGAAEKQEDDHTAIGNRTIFSDDPTYIQPRYNDGSIYGDDDNNMVREEMLEVYAPSGKLGVVIDNPDGRNPTIHAVKITSPVASQVRVGDRVVAVDDEDVRGMSAMKVSRLISRKSGNATRKFTIIRHVHC